MKKLLAVGLAAVALVLGAVLVGPTIARAVGEAGVVHGPFHYDSCTPVSATNAVNTVTTLTLSPGPNQAVFLCGLDLNVSNSATGAVVSTNLTFTSTNLGGWLYKFSAVNAANTNGLDKSFTWPVGGVRSPTPGQAITFTSPAVNAQASYTITAYYYFAAP